MTPSNDSRCVRSYVGDALNLEGAALTPTDTEQHLRSRGAGEELAEQVHELLERLEAARYGAGSGTEDAAAMIDDIGRILRSLDGRIQ